MKFCLDTSDLSAVKRISAMLPVTGVTTNPSIVCAGGVPLFELLPKLREAMGGTGTLFAQVISLTTEGIIKEAQELHSKVDNIVVKIPATPAGLAAIKELSKQNIPTLGTAVYGAAQGLMAALAGAKYISPYVSRIDAQGGDGIQTVSELQCLLTQHAPEVDIVAASFKSPRQALECMMIGCKGMTIAPDIVDLFLNDPAVGVAVEQFKTAWEKTFNKSTL